MEKVDGRKKGRCREVKWKEAKERKNEREGIIEKNVKWRRKDKREYGIMERGKRNLWTTRDFGYENDGK